MLLAYPIEHRRQVQLVGGAYLRGDDAEDHAHVAALLKDVDTEASQARDAVCHIDFRSLFEFLFLARRHHAERHVQHVFGGDARLLRQRDQVAINAQVGIVSYLQMQIGGAAFHGNAEQVVDIHAGMTPAKLSL